jgi:CheY-like chemotaxis protein
MGDRRQLVLYVDDDRDLSEVVSEILEAEGFAAATASHGREALAILDRGLAPDVVVSDMMMPVMDGLTFLARYRARTTPAAPVLAVSAFEAYLDAARAAGAAATLLKPFTIDALAAAVRALTAGRPPPAPPPRLADLGAEAARVAEVVRLGVDRGAPTPAMQAFSERVARIFDVPICLVSIVTEDRQFWHASCGLPDDLAADRGTPRGDSFCTHAVAARAALVVQDTLENPFFRDNRLVSERGLRFYAGVPLFSRADEAVGTLCILDFASRGFGYFDLELLAVLARRVTAELEWRERRDRPRSPLSAFRSLEYLDEDLDVLGRAGFVEALAAEALRSAERGLSLTVGVAVVPPERTTEAAEALKAAFPRAHVGRLGRWRLAVAVLDQAETATRAALAAACGPEGRVLASAVPGPRAGRDVLARLERELGDAGLAR